MSPLDPAAPGAGAVLVLVDIDQRKRIELALAFSAAWSAVVWRSGRTPRPCPPCSATASATWAHCPRS
ncbi:hypothetical protein [Candidatus Thiodictyon syntrophicum]|uniref:hypothetical protein n=1 Tax=Candidatus Thiodictyon syntrophicum TaxID=1166950 RepID=UPI0012FE2008|nr:hypothetical protein [Candidatus Thiodictyon syntrophicum]